METNEKNLKNQVKKLRQNTLMFFTYMTLIPPRNIETVLEAKSFTLKKTFSANLDLFVGDVILMANNKTRADFKCWGGLL